MFGLLNDKCFSPIQYGDAREQYNPKIGNYYENYRQPIQQKTWGNSPEEVQYGQYPQETGNKDWHPENVPGNKN